MRGRSLILLGILLAGPLGACALVTGPDPQDAAERFLTALARGDTAAAAAATDAPAQARPVLDAARRELEPTGLRADIDQVRETGDSAQVAFTAVWQLGERRAWRYPGSLELRPSGSDRGSDWVVHWEPSVLHPQLSAGETLTLREQPAELAPILDRDGGPLLAPEPVVVVLLDPGTPDLPAVADALAGPLSQFDAEITAASILAGAQQTAPGRAYPVAVLREADYQSVRPEIYELPGVRFSAQTRQLAPASGFGAQVLSSVRDVVRQQITGTPGWRVVTVAGAGSGAEIETLFEQPAQAGTPVTTTLSRAVQAAAEDAVEPMPQQAMIVVLQPSTGEMLAVAQNSAADAEGPLALTGRYPPGSTFKIATAAAVLQAGLTPQTPVDCPPTTTVEGRVIPNIDRVGLGAVPLIRAFARSCNTTFAQLAADLAPRGLTEAARQLGVGMDYQVRGVTTVTGSVPPTANTLERAVDGIGQGTVLASPFGMALAVSTVAAGALPTPVLIRGSQTAVNGPAPPPLPAAVTGALQTMTREVVITGTASALAGLGAVHGKTGTAQFGDASRSHGWFVGYRGDLAFAVLVVDGGSSGPAVEAAGRFLSAVP